MVAAIRRPPSYQAPPWRLVGPWYRWQRPGHPQDGRGSRPSIQKFAGDDFLTGFLERPQYSLKYDPIVDVVNNYDLASAAPGGSMAGKVSTLFKVNSKGEPAGSHEPAFRARLAPSGLRKLYQPAHDRHYLVTCELHCDEPGFPRVGRAQVCQAGFVLRRRKSIVPPGVTAAMINAQTASVHRAEADLHDLLQLSATLDEPLASAALKQATRERQQALADAAGVGDWSALLLLRRNDLAKLRRELDDWYADNGIQVQVQGWFPRQEGGRPSRHLGAWQTLDADAQQADPAQSGETRYPLFALVPDPRETGHDAAGRTFYYGTVPTAGIEHDDQGVARLDDRGTYELRCFVRAHHPCPERAGKQPDCYGPVVWSPPSEAFRVAAPFDVLGAANRPVSIKMPDLRDLAAQAAMRPRGKLSPVRFIQPQQLAPGAGDKGLKDGELRGEAICSFSIPLITIIALFLLNLFLPIVVFLFNLWFLLVFRFCIPPSIQASAGVDAALAVTPPSVDLDVDFAVEVSGVDQLATQLNALLNTSLDVRVRDAAGSLDHPSLAGLSNNALGPLAQSFEDAAGLEPDADGALPPPPPVGTALVYEDPVEPVWPAAGGSA